jgi:transposase-like protein
VAQGKRFSPEFRQKAVRLYRVSEQPYRAVAEELAVVPESTGSAERRPRQAVVRSAREEVCRCRTLAETRHAPLNYWHADRISAAASSERRPRSKPVDWEGDRPCAHPLESWSAERR